MNPPFVPCWSKNCTCAAMEGSNYCTHHQSQEPVPEPVLRGVVNSRRSDDQRMSFKYPQYYKPVPEGVTELDFYAVCQMFGVADAALSHSLKKLLLPGVRTGNKTRWHDIKEARDTLNRWLELNPKPEAEQ